MRLPTTIVLAAVAALTQAGCLAATDSPPAWETKAEVAGILASVPPLNHPLGKFQPTLFWWQAPLAFDNPKQLKHELRGLMDRGILPCVEVSADYPDHRAYPATSEATARALAQARAIAAAGYPVHLAMKGVLDLYRTPGGPEGQLVRHANVPDAGQKDAVGQEFPCLFLQDGWRARAELIRGLMRQFAAARIRVAGVWYDYEGHPHPWNGIVSHMGRCPGCQAQIRQTPALQRQPTDLPPLSDMFDVWVGWAENYRAEALDESFAKPVRAVFPSARVGFYGFTVSSAASPTGGAERNPVGIGAVQPVCYAQPVTLARSHFGTNAVISQTAMDQVYFLGLLGAVTGVAPNLRRDQVLMPYICGHCDEGNPAILRLSRSVYREFLRHAILRGARGFYCFNVGPPYGRMADYYGELADINVVYNELLAYRQFLEDGEPINSEMVVPITPVTAHGDWRQPNNTNTWSRAGIVNGVRVWLPTPKVTTATVWSALRRRDQALVRVVTLGTTSTFADVTPFPGTIMRLLATPAGATYIVSRSGSIRAVD